MLKKIAAKATVGTSERLAVLLQPAPVIAAGQPVAAILPPGPAAAL